MTASTRESMEKKHRKNEKALRETYKSKELQLHTLTAGGLLYSFYVTALTVITTVRFKLDCKAFVEEICKVMAWIWKNVIIKENSVIFW